MTHFQRTVLLLLVKIFERLRQANGVAHYGDEDEAFLTPVRELAAGRRRGFVTVPEATVRAAVAALERVAREEVGMSQGPDLIIAEQTQEWCDAQILRSLMEDAA